MADKFAALEIATDQRHKGTRVGTLWADFDSGSGDVTLTLDFCNEYPLMRADVLGDIIGLLEREYEMAVRGIFPEVKSN